jgi:hypothetical protein
MKSFVYAMVAASALAAPLASYAQTSGNNGPVTRAEVRQDLINVERAGYNPSARSPYYPDDIQAAEQRLNAQQGQEGYGGVSAGSSQSGAPSAARPMGAGNSPQQSIYFGQ